MRQNKGGEGSGNHGHAGRPGLVGGSGGGGGGLLDYEHPHVLAISPTGQELDIPSINWSFVGKLWLASLPLLEKIQESADFADLYHVALEQVYEVIASPTGEAAMSILPNLFKASDGKAQTLIQDFQSALEAKDNAKALIAADQLLALCYEIQHSSQDESQKKTVDASVTAMEQIVKALGDDPAKVKTLWLKARKDPASKARPELLHEK